MVSIHWWSIRNGAPRSNIVLKGPKGIEPSKAIKFGFQVTNNVAEYEAPFARLQCTRNIGINSLYACSDSQLLVSQLKTEYKVREPRFRKYVNLTKKMMEKFDEVFCQKGFTMRKCISGCSGQGIWVCWRANNIEHRYNPWNEHQRMLESNTL